MFVILSTHFLDFFQRLHRSFVLLRPSEIIFLNFHRDDCLTAGTGRGRTDRNA